MLALRRSPSAGVLPAWLHMSTESACGSHRATRTLCPQARRSARRFSCRHCVREGCCISKERPAKPGPPIYLDWRAFARFCLRMPPALTQCRQPAIGRRRREPPCAFAGVDAFYTLLTAERVIDRLVFAVGFDVKLGDGAARPQWSESCEMSRPRWDPRRRDPHQSENASAPEGDTVVAGVWRRIGGRRAPDCE